MQKLNRTMLNKGEKRVFLCGETGRAEVIRLNRDRSENNSYFDEIKRGDFVEVEGIYKKGTLLRAGRETVVRPAALI